MSLLSFMWHHFPLSKYKDKSDIVYISVESQALILCHSHSSARKMSGKAAISSDAVSVTSSTPSISWKGWLWDSADVSAEERRFLLKLDFTLLTFGTLGMLIKWVGI